jgi:GH24 family phage-related lysozyme (muramidase)
MSAMLRAGLVTLTAVLTSAVWVPGAAAAPTGGGASGAEVPQAATSAVVGPQAFDVSAALDGRTARRLSNHAVVDKYPAGSSVVVLCQAAGGATYEGSRIWDLTSDGLWVPDHFVATGTGGYAPNLPPCTLPKSYVATRSLDGRTEKRIGNHAQPDRYPQGSTIKVSCQAFGGPTYHGSYLWDRTVEGLWIPDYFVTTGTNGLVAGLPLCDVTPAGPTSTARLKPSDLQFSSRGATFIAAYEGYRSTAYDDAGGHCTIGYGHLIHRGGCTAGDRARWGTLGSDRALALLWQDAETYAAGVRASLPDTPLHQHEFDALVSLSYNIGNGGFRSSSVRAGLASSEPDYAAVPDRMLRWVSSSGVKLAGLQRRRVNEGKLFSTGSYAIIPASPYSSY